MKNWGVEQKQEKMDQEEMISALQGSRYLDHAVQKVADVGEAVRVRRAVVKRETDRVEFSLHVVSVFTRKKY